MPNISRTYKLLVLLLLCGTAIIVMPTFGTHPVSLTAALSQPNSTDAAIFWQLRVPRVLLAFFVGSGLALCGMCFQALFRNPLATPYTLGISAGAAFGASLSISLGISFTAMGLDSSLLFAFFGALLSMGLVYGITLLKKGFSASTMLLAGISVNLFFSSLILFLQYTSDFIDSFKIMRWLMGGLDTVGYQSVILITPIILAGTTILYILTRELNLLAVGEEFAISRGVSTHLCKATIFIITSVIVGTSVSLCGPIGFVGMMAPHICRLLIGNDHKFLAPASFLFGGAFLVICDTISRTIVSPAEMPVGIITAMLGGPFFIWLLLTKHSDTQFNSQ